MCEKKADLVLKRDRWYVPRGNSQLTFYTTSELGTPFRLAQRDEVLIFTGRERRTGALSFLDNLNQTVFIQPDDKEKLRPYDLV